MPYPSPRSVHPTETHETTPAPMQQAFLSPSPQVLISGISTGLNLIWLMAAREPLRAGLPSEALYGMTPEAGLPRGWNTGLANGSNT
jgi:hypothetical protein